MVTARFLTYQNLQGNTVIKKLITSSVAVLLISGALNASTIVISTKQSKVANLRNHIATLEAQVKQKLDAKAAAFKNVEKWLDGWAAWGLICAALGCDKQNLLLEKMKECKKEDPCTPCINDTLQLLSLTEEQRRDALPYMFGIPKLDQEISTLRGTISDLNEQLEKLENN